MEMVILIASIGIIYAIRYVYIGIRCGALDKDNQAFKPRPKWYEAGYNKDDNPTIL